MRFCVVYVGRMSVELSEDEIYSKWPLHWLVWKDDHKALKRLLRDAENEVSSSSVLGQQCDLSVLLVTHSTTWSSVTPGEGLLCILQCLCVE